MSEEQPEALPVRLAKRLCDGISTGHDWPNTDDELLRMQSAAELRRLHAENEALRAQIGQGVPDGVLDALDNFEKKERSPFQAYLAAGLVSELRTALLASAHPAPQQKPLTDEQITAGAKALCKRSSEICGVNADDNWNLESEYFKDDARCVLEAAHNIGEKK